MGATIRSWYCRYSDVVLTRLYPLSGYALTVVFGLLSISMQMIAMVEESGRGDTTYYGGAQARAPEGLDKYLGNTGWFMLIYFVLLSNSDAPLGCKLEGVMKKIPPKNMHSFSRSDDFCGQSRCGADTANLRVANETPFKG